MILAPRVGGYIQARWSWHDEVGTPLFLNRSRVGLDGPLPSRFGHRMPAEYPRRVSRARQRRADSWILQLQGVF